MWPDTFPPTETCTCTHVYKTCVHVYHYRDQTNATWTCLNINIVVHLLKTPYYNYYNGYYKQVRYTIQSVPSSNRNGSRQWTHAT